jgi:hypothetical protein
MPEPVRTLVRCPVCGAECVIPVDFAECGDDAWWFALRCGACGASREVTASDDEADRLGRDLDDGVRSIAAEIERIERAPINASDFER